MAVNDSCSTGLVQRMREGSRRAGRAGGRSGGLARGSRRRPDELGVWGAQRTGGGCAANGGGARKRGSVVGRGDAVGRERTGHGTGWSPARPGRSAGARARSGGGQAGGSVEA